VAGTADEEEAGKKGKTAEVAGAEAAAVEAEVVEAEVAEGAAVEGARARGAAGVGVVVEMGMEVGVGETAGTEMVERAREVKTAARRVWEAGVVAEKKTAGMAEVAAVMVVSLRGL
jgi:hypothetical protein